MSIVKLLIYTIYSFKYWFMTRKKVDIFQETEFSSEIYLLYYLINIISLFYLLSSFHLGQYQMMQDLACLME